MVNTYNFGSVFTKISYKLHITPGTQYYVIATYQGRRHVFESGTVIERRRHSPSAEGTSGGEHERG